MRIPFVTSRPLARARRCGPSIQWVALWAMLMGAAVGSPAATLVLNQQRLHLGQTNAPEWEWFAGRAPDASRFERRFRAESNAQPATLFLRQDDVKQDWPVELNGKRLGKLFPMEADLGHRFDLPPGSLRDGENVLAILPPKDRDDIVLQEIWIDPRPAGEAVAEATLEATVVDAASGSALPARLTVTDARGVLAPIIADTNGPPLAVRPGVIYTGDGRARVGLPAGDYQVYASRGFEWSVATQRVQVISGQVARASLVLRREVATPGLVSCDTHVHTFTHSRHGDATIEERMLTLAGEGIELPISTDHNLHIEYAEPARRLGVDRYFTPVTGNEVTTPAGHFNVFPVKADARVPDFRITHWPTLMKTIRETPNVRVVILNHPRNVHNGFQPFAATNFNAVTGANKRGAEFTFDAMELLNSSAQQTDYLLVYRDWFALLNHGYRITAVGSSDGHDVSRYIVGQGRTYIACPDQDPSRIEVATACLSLVEGRALVSMGLLTQMTVDDRYGVGDLARNIGKTFRVTIRVLGPSWVEATNVTLYANGLKLREEDLSSPALRRAKPLVGDGERVTVTWDLPRPAHDVHLVAIATGPAVTAPFWAIPRPYQPVSTRWQGRVIGSTNPIWLDADGDGQFQPARAYARRLVERYGPAPARLLPQLARYDRSVAAQVASLCRDAGVDLSMPPVTEAMRKAATSARLGFEDFIATGD